MHKSPLCDEMCDLFFSHSKGKAVEFCRTFLSLSQNKPGRHLNQSHLSSDFQELVKFDLQAPQKAHGSILLGLRAWRQTVFGCAGDSKYRLRLFLERFRQQDYHAL